MKEGCKSALASKAWTLKDYYWVVPLQEQGGVRELSCNL